MAKDKIAKPKLKAKASPTLKPKASPKLAPKASPKLAPKASPKLAPKPSPKLAPKTPASAKKRKSQEDEDQKKPKKAKKQEATSNETLAVCKVADIKEISEASAKALLTKSITTLFEIQQKAFQPCFKGQDVVGRAKTGCGKTLAFVLPVVERIRAKGFAKQSRKKAPLCVTIAPTRELAKQIFNDFELLGAAGGLAVKCFYGGTPFGPQCDDLRAGIHILVGTPGRLLDHVRRQTADLSACKTLVLDEADEMLSMGFQEDIEAILDALPTSDCQKLLFSATLPKWVNAIVEKHLSSPVWIDVAQDPDGNKTNSLITHQCVSCPPSARGDCIGDLCKIHAGAYGKTMVFVSTKRDCDELAANEKLQAIGAGVLHGDIPQHTREKTMDGFRAGRIRCLVATDVAARGIDVPAVDLVVQTRPPQDLESYVHRSGRTGRAGRKGTSVCFYSRSEEYLIRLIEHKKGIKMQRVGPPQARDVVGAAADDAVRQIDNVHQASVEAFAEKARELIEERGAEVALAATMAALTGHFRELKGRSLLSSYEGQTAMILKSERLIETASKGWYLLRQMLSQEIADALRGCKRCKDEYQCIFDAPDELVPKILKIELWKGNSIAVAKELPELEEETDIQEATQKHWESKQRFWEKRKGGGKGDKGDKGKGRGKGPGRGKGEGRGKGAKLSPLSSRPYTNGSVPMALQDSDDDMLDPRTPGRPSTDPEDRGFGPSTVPRSCTDACWIIPFVICLGLFVYVSSYALQNGDLSTLLSLPDRNGNLCGHGLNREKPFLYFCMQQNSQWAFEGNDKRLDMANPICVGICPGNYNTSSRCWLPLNQSYAWVQDYPTRSFIGFLCRPSRLFTQAVYEQFQRFVETAPPVASFSMVIRAWETLAWVAGSEVCPCVPALLQGLTRGQHCVPEL
ncbi:unnamed protein product [Effrenium voratum]|nr:unnamed protein product [Effrenium voratum]